MSHVIFNMSPVTCHQRQQQKLEPQTLPLLTPKGVGKGFSSAGLPCLICVFIETYYFLQSVHDNVDGNIRETTLDKLICSTL